MTQRTTSFDAKQLLASLDSLPGCPVFWVGYSGGADSTALLHALHEIHADLSTRIKVLHINHGLHTDSDAWQSHCENYCRQLGFEIHTRKVTVSRNSGYGLEAEARRLRYKAVERILSKGEIFLTAHHRDDQAETLLLHLFRGSGVDGLAGMPALRSLGCGLLARPLLGFSAESLRQYLVENNTEWLEDPSNQDQAHDRNFVRQNLLPQVEKRWPGVSGRIARSADLCRQASTSLASLASTELENHLIHPQILNLDGLDLQAPMFPLLLRQWLRMNKTPSLPANQIHELRRQCTLASSGSRVRIAWQGWVIQLFQHSLWLQPAKSIVQCPEIYWTVPGPLNLGTGLGVLKLLPIPDPWPGQLMVESRQGGEQILSQASSHKKAVKDLLREASIPHWMRPSIPLLKDAKSLLAVGDLALCRNFAKWLDQGQSSLSWTPTDPLLIFVHDRYAAGTVDHSGTVR